ncbi:hypothetical protein DP1979 [Desulfotalea psychrophila LSv54]|uniref:Tll0287-like domain-containing protein n=2 Tax=Desulfotalea psychrophila TaxID=84980 RepID=Q6ALR7_DESPS|nr:hypothetical protein DP1979 [Desulfotalea psychrophila LSv54]
MPMREIVVNDDLTLTKVNPAFMTRQISDITRVHEGVQFHLTSLKPLRPGNRATAREREFLKEFASGTREKELYSDREVKDSFFYMAPLITEKACLQCHARQGYREGDIRGGVSITTPYAMPTIFPTPYRPYVNSLCRPGWYLSLWVEIKQGL